MAPLDTCSVQIDCCIRQSAYILFYIRLFLVRTWTNVQLVISSVLSLTSLFLSSHLSRLHTVNFSVIYACSFSFLVIFLIWQWLAVLVSIDGYLRGFAELLYTIINRALFIPGHDIFCPIASSNMAHNMIYEIFETCCNTLIRISTGLARPLLVLSVVICSVTAFHLALVLETGWVLLCRPIRYHGNNFEW